ncbi:ABC transporter ATP-binding protein [Oceanicoccus sp. KOV_DT_Chl]|uniref:ABC transporter ATP-binding protein n=1 Tax=Oceanicoccus sp. KOV_DT_Chl TaxID=1904639 RepID=UPI000C7C6C7B|nr:ABC transporter ATP-binding protein [Oceanicoccus sp. KOV_DT_Chl]
MSVIELPSYLEQSDKVKARLAKLKQRETILEVKGLCKNFVSPQGATINALKDINFKTHRREFVCVIGPSGCGKSTLIRMLAGLESPSGGQVLLDGKPVSLPGPDRGMVFQGYTLFPWLSVKHNVMFGLEMSGHSKATAEGEAMDWIELVGLTKFADNYPHQLSGGMKQRVAIARALANKPRILLMDEPFGALDAQTRSKMQENLLEIWRNIDITVLFITHDLDEAIYLADRILVLKAHPGEVNELIEVPVPRPRTVEQFISPEFLATKKRLEELIHPPTTDEDEPAMSMVRMVRVGDDVENGHSDTPFDNSAMTSEVE